MHTAIPVLVLAVLAPLAKLLELPPLRDGAPFASRRALVQRRQEVGCREKDAPPAERPALLALAEQERVAPPPEADAARTAAREELEEQRRALSGRERREWIAAFERSRQEGLATQRNSPGTRYEHLRAALQLAVDLGDLRALRELTAELARQFEIDALALECEFTRAASDRGTLSPAVALKALFALAERAVPARATIALEALASAELQVQRLLWAEALDEPHAREFVVLEARVAGLAAEEHRRAALAHPPLDAASAERLGWLLCLRLERWSEGLPLLASHASSTLPDGSAAKEIARLELSNEPSDTDLRRIATAWRQVAEDLGLDLLERRAVLRRAADRQALLAAPTALDRLELDALNERIALMEANFAQRANGRVEAPTVAELALRFPRGPRDPQRPRAEREHAVNLALRWLKAHQEEDGSWSADAFHRRCEVVPCDGAGSRSHHVGVTGLALLAFLGDGHHPTRKTVYQRVVRNGVKWLVANMSEGEDDGLIGGRSHHAFLYDHAIAALTLCEAYLLSQQESLRGPAQRAVNFVLRARNPHKAWRYAAPGNGENDSSITGWMVQVLHTAESAGLDIDQAAYAGALALFDELTDPATGRCGYLERGEPPVRPGGKAEKWPATSSESLTAVALLCRMFLGETPRTNPRLSAHAELLLTKLPVWKGEDASTVDLYYWAHGAFAMFLMGGKYWEKWNDAMKPTLLAAQRQDGHLAGSWDPVDPWGEEGGRIYATAMCVRCLQIYYHYERK